MSGSILGIWQALIYIVNATSGWRIKMMYDNWPFWPFMGIFWVIIVILISRAGWWSRGYRRDSASETSALDILKQRYAKGEINKAEFDEMKKDVA